MKTMQKPKIKPKIQALLDKINPPIEKTEKVDRTESESGSLFKGV